MPQFNVSIRVMPRASLLDPEGQAVEHALETLGFEGVDGVRVGKALTLTLDGSDAAQAEQVARKMCERLLSNPVTQDFSISVTQDT